MKKYRETLYFIGKCLTLGQEPGRIPEIRTILQSGIHSWEDLVWVSSRQMVLPALFVRLREAALLNELPSDLLEHMENIHSVNLKRNTIILDQVVQISKLLNEYNIFPIYLKGTAHLLQGLYGDMGERMIGDIDILLPEEQILEAVELLNTLGYSYPNPIGREELSRVKHYPRLRSESVVAAIELHRQPVSAPYDLKFNYALIQPEIEKLDKPEGAFVLSHPHQIVHNMMNVQMNDRGYVSGKVFLRQVYDLLLLSKKADPREAILQFSSFPKELEANLAVSSMILNHPIGLQSIDNKHSRRYFRRIHFLLGHQKIHKFYRVIQKIGYRLKRYILLVVSAIFLKYERKTVLKRLGSRDWYRRHLRSWKRMRNE